MRAASMTGNVHITANRSAVFLHSMREHPTFMATHYPGGNTSPSVHLLADQRRLPELTLDLDTYLEQCNRQTEAWKDHLRYVADVWDYSTAWNRCMREGMFIHYLRPETLHQVRDSRAMLAAYRIRLRLAKSGVDEETPPQLLEHIRRLGNNIAALEALLGAIDALPIDGQTIDGQTQEDEQQGRARVFRPQKYQGTLEELGLPTVAQRVQELDAHSASDAPRDFMSPRCESCERPKCGCSERFRKLPAEWAEWTERQKRARQVDAWRSDANQRAVTERVRKRAAARKVWVSPAEKIVF